MIISQIKVVLLSYEVTINVTGVSDGSGIRIGGVVPSINGWMLIFHDAIAIVVGGLTALIGEWTKESQDDVLSH